MGISKTSATIVSVVYCPDGKRTEPMFNITNDGLLAQTKQIVDNVRYRVDVVLHLPTWGDTPAFFYAYHHGWKDCQQGDIVWLAAPVRRRKTKYGKMLHSVQKLKPPKQ